MFHPPESPVRERMLLARGTACATSGVVDAAGDELWGYAGRTLSGLVRTRTGDPAWLRLVSEPEAKAHGKLWDGPKDAERLVPGAVRRPTLLGLQDWTSDGWAYRAELYEAVTASTVSRSPVLSAAPVEPPDAWWDDLHAALDALASVPTDRQAVREEYIRRRVPVFTGLTPIEISWATAHGDLHWANLVAPRFTLLDWEGWGTAPVGYDAATLYLHSLPAPEVAARVHKEFAHILGTSAGKVAELVACTEILQAAPRVPFYADLVKHPSFPSFQHGKLRALY